MTLKSNVEIDIMKDRTDKRDKDNTKDIAHQNAVQELEMIEKINAEMLTLIGQETRIMKDIMKDKDI